MYGTIILFIRIPSINRVPITYTGIYYGEFINKSMTLNIIHDKMHLFVSVLLFK